MAVKESADNPFGVLEFLHWNHPWNQYKYPSEKELEKAVKLINKSGAGWVRLDFLWEDIEKQKGEFDFAKYDLIVDILNKHKIRVLGLLNYCAPWASPSGKWNNPPKDNKPFLNYATAVISRYKDKVKHWEVWNEPDSSIYWVNQDGLKSYCALLKEVYRAAKSADPKCTILNGGFSESASSVNLLYENGAKDYFDIMNIHIFETPLREKSIYGVRALAKLVYKVMSRNNDGHKKIWVTEIGCPGVPKGVETGNWWLGANPSEEEQAKWLNEVYTELLKDKNVEKVFWAFFRDCKGHWANGVDYFGLVRWDFSPKPSFTAFQKCFNQWKKNLSCHVRD